MKSKLETWPNVIGQGLCVVAVILIYIYFVQ